MATWESWDSIHQAFPRPTAWGQAASQAPGTVITTALGEQDEEEEAAGPRRGARDRRPNKRIAGDEWA
jgi:hypothetical protein